MSFVSVITCTGHRPEAFALCQKYMQRQTYDGALQWIVVNDAYSKEEVEAFKNRNKIPFELYAGPQKWTEGVNTQRWNMLEALKHVKGDKLLIIEDEDYYKPTYIEEMVKLLEHVDVVGEANAKYYNVSIPGYKEMHNLNHSSLCQTAIRSSMYKALKDAVDSGELYFDIHLWQHVQAKQKNFLLLHNKNLCIGVKGMPGRSGIGAGHKLRDYMYDSDLSKLRELFGADAANYVPYLKGSHGRESSARNVPTDSKATDARRGVLQQANTVSRSRTNSNAGNSVVSASSPKGSINTKTAK